MERDLKKRLQYLKDQTKPAREIINKIIKL